MYIESPPIWSPLSRTNANRSKSGVSFPILTGLRLCEIRGSIWVSEIASRMGVASNYASQYKRRLLGDGVIGERERGLVGFDIPAFREFLSQKAF